jgi:hypothetical protein
MKALHEKWRMRHRATLNDLRQAEHFLNLAQQRYMRDAHNPRKEPDALKCMDHWAHMVNRAHHDLRQVQEEWRDAARQYREGTP